ncbi:putative cyclase [Nocardioides albertanoniae]|uniref:Putative cyclase n=1 Tax=Nocardioides albertanoniae TaxID=1175486 RepID=A0A543A9Z3_9ACTN|nr:cyclase family protein [Nocardioides albertanoniae]TQL69422.1 putative cyclase [Nocardioides albertanoniae]
MSTDLRQDVPTYAQLKVRRDGLPGSSWGVFGPGDEMGMINFLTPDHAVAAAGLVRTGKTFNLDFPVNSFVPAPGGTRPAAVHRMFANNPNHRDDWLDSYYLQQSSQIDGLRHIRDPEHGFYGGVPDAAVDVGKPSLGIQNLAEKGVVGRGVLLDLGRYFERRGTPIDMASNQMFTTEDLEGAAAEQGVAFRSGDILMIRYGWARYYLETLTQEERGEFSSHIRHPGLKQCEEMVAWLWDHQFSMVASDDSGVEAHPVNPDSGFVDPDEPAPERGVLHNGMLHRPLIAMLGLSLGELWDLDALAEDCARDGVYEFLLTAKPLNLVGGVGSPANAIAVK